MKKTFRSILAGAVALLAVSCYDDSALRGDIEKLDERVTAIENALNAEVGGLNDLATRLAAAEGAIETLEGQAATFTTQVTGILTRLDAIDGAADGKIKSLEDAIAALQTADQDFDKELAAAAAKIAVVKVEEKAGNWVLTLADGSEVALSKPLSNVENSGLVTVVKVDGVDCWATVAADGTVTSLGVPVGHPDYVIAFQVTEDGKLTYTVNGGEPVETGVTTADLSGQKYLINSVKVSEDGKSVSITIGEAEYVLPVYAPVPTVQIKAGKQFFKNGESKSVEIGIENVSNLAVMNQPYGWKASVKGSKLTVTAPSEANVDAETSGVVVLHGDANGQCMTAALNVAVGAGMELTIDATGLITIYNPIVTAQTDYWGEVVGMGFGNAAIGVMTVDAFNSFSSMQELYTAVQSDYDGAYGASAYLENIKYNLELGGEYDAETYTVDTLSFTIAQFGACTWPSLEPVKGEKYVVWAVPQDSETALYDDAVFAYYEPVLVEPVETITYNEISLSLSLYGTDMVYAGMLPASMFDDEMAAEQWPNGFDSYMELGYGMGGPWKQFQQYGFESIGQPVANGGTVSVAELNYGSLLPDTKYYVWLMPKKGAKAPAEYDYAADFKPYVFEYTTANIVGGGKAAELTLSNKTDYSSITVDVTVPEGTTATYKFYSTGGTDEFENEQALVKDILEYGKEVAGGVAKESYLSDGKTMTLVVVTVDADGKYAIAQEAFSTLSYPVVKTITVSVDSITKGEGQYTAVVSVTGAAKVAIYSAYNSSNTNFNKYLMAKNTTMKYGNVVDGKATVAFTASNDNYYILVSAYNENEDGTVKEFCKYVPVQISSMLQ